LKEGIIIFIDGMIRTTATGNLLPTNFRKGRMKKLIDDKLGSTNSMHIEDAMSYSIEVGQNKVEASPKTNRKVMIRGAQAIKNLIGWDDPVDSTTIRAYLVNEDREKEPQDAIVEVKKGRIIEEDETEEPTNKKKVQTSKGTTGPGPTNHTRQRQEAQSTAPHPGDASLSKERWEEASS